MSSSLRAVARADSAALVLGALTVSATGRWIYNGGLIAGAATATLLSHAAGLETTLLLAAFVLPALAVISLGVLRRADDDVEAQSRQVHDGGGILQGMRVFTGADLLTLERPAAVAAEVAMPADAAIVRQGESADDFYVLADGEVEVTQTRARRRPVVLRRLSAPDYFAEIGLLRGSPRTATVTGVGPVHLLRISDEDFPVRLDQRCRDRHGPDGDSRSQPERCARTSDAHSLAQRHVCVRS